MKFQRFIFVLFAIALAPLFMQTQTVAEDLSPVSIYKRAVLKKLSPPLKEKAKLIYSKYLGQNFPLNIDTWGRRLDPGLRHLVLKSIDTELVGAKGRVIVRAEPGTAAKLRAKGVSIGTETGDMFTAGATLRDVLVWTSYTEVKTIDGGVLLLEAQNK
jgi:hypothetical protein